ncbi:hypothetical protein AAVH_37657 [Aphelenchoides avenae]|nr:hypothetical protein AAVH_37657 [Aphelenchus avenae]
MERDEGQQYEKVTPPSEAVETTSETMQANPDPTGGRGTRNGYSVKDNQPDMGSGAGMWS